MHLKNHLSCLPRAERKAERKKLADFCKTTSGHLQNVAYGYRIPSAGLCVALEQATDKKITRQALRPDDWQKIWPELATAKAA